MDLPRLDRRQVLRIHGLQGLEICAMEQLVVEIPVEKLNGSVDFIARRPDDSRDR